MKAGVFLLLLGIIVLSGPLILAFLDSRDFFVAFFADRGSEEIGLGIQGLQLFHCFMVGIAMSTFGGSLLAMKQNKRNPLDSISSDSYGPSILPRGNMKRPETSSKTMTGSKWTTDLMEEMTRINGTNLRDSEGGRPSVSQDTDIRSTQSLIDRASSLLTKGRTTKAQDSAPAENAD